MVDVRVRHVEEQVVAELKAQAKRRGHTLGEDLRALLADAAWRPRREMLEQLKRMHEEQRAECGVLPDSAPGIRAWRDGLE